MPKTVERDIEDTRTDREKVKIDRSQLDDEWCRIADDIYAAAEKVTDFEAEILALNRRKKKLQTSFKLKIRAAPEDYGLEKLTEAGIEDALSNIKKYREADEAVEDVKILQMRAKNLVTGLVEKRRGLESVMTLFGWGYFADPKDKTSAADSMRREATNGRIQSALKKKGR